MRSFVNDVAPDPLAYAGQKREPILVAVTQSICWMVSRSWSELPELTEGTYCGADLPGVGSRVQLDDFVLITHSLGSRATLDAMQRLTNLPVSADPRLKRIADNFATRDIQVFMLSNQLPLLEAGREGQQVTGQIGAYCGPDATKPGRFFDKTEIIAFSDPNDLMSYPVPDKFADKYIESRLCPSVTNVTINVVDGELAARAWATSPTRWARISATPPTSGSAACSPRAPATRTWRRSWPSAALGARPTRA